MSGYTIGSVRNGLDVAQCRLALQRVALLHSSYLALRELLPKTADRLNNIFERAVWSKDDPIVIDFKRGYWKGLGEKDIATILPISIFPFVQ